jgi:hypothetical protein
MAIGSGKTEIFFPFWFSPRSQFHTGTGLFCELSQFAFREPIAKMSSDERILLDVETRAGDNAGKRNLVASEPRE